MRIPVKVEFFAGGLRPVVINQINIKMPIQIPVKIIKGTPPPTIVGVDFLLNAKLKFFFNPSVREAYLETSD